jgi:hypothetical protein
MCEERIRVVDNSGDVSRSGAPHRIATLWELAWNDERLACVVCRVDGGLRLCIESSTAVLVSERFTMEPRAIARVRALRDSLQRRGWHDTAAVPSSVME